MKNRLNQILAGILGMQIVLGALVFWPRGPQAEQGTVFPGLEAASVMEITIEDDTGAVVRIDRDGDQWVLPDADNYPALQTEIDALLGGVLGITIGDTVTSSETAQAALQVADDNFLRKITLTDADGGDHVLFLGTSPRYAATHFRVGGETDTHLAVDVNVDDVNARASDWVDAVYLRANQEDLVGLVVTNTLGEFSFSKGEGGPWMFTGLAAGEVQNDAGLNSLLSQSTSVNLTEPIGLTEDPAWGLDDPTAVVEYMTADGSITLTVGAQDPDDLSYVVKSSASDYYVRVREYSVQPFVEAARETFIQQPTATPTTDPALLPYPTEDTVEGEEAPESTPEATPSEPTADPAAPEATPAGG